MDGAALIQQIYSGGARGIHLVSYSFQQLPLIDPGASLVKSEVN